MVLNALATITGSQWRFMNVRNCHDAIRQKLADMGIEAPAELPMNLKAANALYDKLCAAEKAEPAASLTNIATEVAAIKAQPVAIKPAAKPIVAPVAIKPVARPAASAPAPALSPQQVRAIAAVLRADLHNGSDSERFAALEVEAFKQHVRFPGMRDDTEISKTVKRLAEPQKFSAAVRGMRQSAVDKITKGK